MVEYYLYISQICDYIQNRQKRIVGIVLFCFSTLKWYRKRRSVAREVCKTAKITLITSCKGGVGKSTAAANLAMALAKRGCKVLLADCDFDMRCLDLVLGVENDILYDLYDAAKGRVTPERAMLRDER